MKRYVPEERPTEWWSDWYGGAFDASVIVQQAWLRRLRAYAEADERGARYFQDDVDELARSGRIVNPAISSLDALATTFDDLRIMEYDRRVAIQKELVGSQDAPETRRSP